MNNRKAILTTLGIAVVMLVLGVALGSIAFPTAKIETTTQISSPSVSVQNVILSDYNAPAIYGTTQSNGSVLYIPPTTTGSLNFQVVMPQAMASVNPQVSVYLNGESIIGCDSIMTTQAIQNMVEEGLGCMAPVTRVGSSNNLTILVSSSLLIAGAYRYQSFVVTTSTNYGTNANLPNSVNDVPLDGTCTVVSYFVPDSTGTAIQTERLGSSTFLSTIFAANTTTRLAMTSTSGTIFSIIVSVTNCTFG